MKNPLLIKIINKVNLDLTAKFNLDKIKELSFLPINTQDDKLFVAVSSECSRDKVTEYMKTVSDLKFEFISLSQDKFDTLVRLYESKLSVLNYSKNVPMANFQSEENETTQQESISDIQDVDLIKEESAVIEDSRDEVFVNIENNNQEILSDESDESILDEIDVDKSVLDVDIEPSSFEADIQSTEPKVVEPESSASSSMEGVKAPETKKIGEILLESGIITEKQLAIALAESKALDIPLGSVLVKLGYVSIQDLKSALGAQQGLELATTEQLKPIPSVISIFPEDFIRVNKVIPLSMSNKSLVVGMVNPGDTKIINEIVYQTGLKPTVMMITHYEYENFIKTYYENASVEADKIIEEIETEEIEESNEDPLWEQVEKEIQDTKGSISKFANNVITFGIDQKASDIHIEPRFNGYIVRYRIDGILKEVFKIPQKAESQVITRFKVLARMNIAEHRRAQDGSFTIAYKNQKYDFRVNTLPVAGKEKMVIRILAPAVTVSQRKTKITLEGASELDIERVKYLISVPNGIILTSGPTGSGKTTTLYSLISYLNSENVNITTIEDPVEIRLDGVNQSAINTKAGITFASSLRAILRQDPDIILVGEIRDFETLEVAISASLTGHLVLSTIHTNSAAATITRLIEMGAKDYLISSTVSGILAQRLVRKLCPKCKQAYKPTLEEAKKILTDPLEIAEFLKTTIYKPGGCPLCDNTGYSGRTGLFEILVINKEIKKLIAQRAHDVVIEEYAIQNGMKTLRTACIEHIKNGVTTTDEFVRVLGMVSE